MNPTSSTLTHFLLTGSAHSGPEALTPGGSSSPRLESRQPCSIATGSRSRSLGSLLERAAHEKLAVPRASGRGPSRGELQPLPLPGEVGVDTIAKRSPERRQACGTGRRGDEGGWVDGVIAWRGLLDSSLGELHQLVSENRI
jgi:hypothetical protein